MSKNFHRVISSFTYLQPSISSFTRFMLLLTFSLNNRNTTSTIAVPTGSVLPSHRYRQFLLPRTREGGYFRVGLLPLQTLTLLNKLKLTSSVSSDNNSSSTLLLTDNQTNVNLKMPFPFLSLPLELRQMVYDHCLVAPEPVLFKSQGPWVCNTAHRSDQTNYNNSGFPTVYLDALSRRSAEFGEHVNVALLRTCSQVYGEALQNLLTENVFQFLRLHHTNPDAVAWFLSSTDTILLL
jgi:hypothetical protein